MASAEQKKSYAVIKNFRGIDTKANRTAIDKDEFYWLENVMPVGPGNLRITPQSNYINNSSGNAVVFSNNVTYLTSCNISDDYIVAAEANGALQYYDITSNTVGTIVTAGNLSSSGVSATQYQNTDLYIGDPSKGLFDWTGNAFVSVGSIGVIAITNPGGGYTTAPTVTISPPNQAGGDQATAVATITTGVGGVQSIQVTNGGSNFTSVPTVTIGAPQVAGGTQATAAATIQGGNVVAITMQVSGSGYSAIPSVSITGGGGSGATANAVLSSGIVNSITLTNAGSGYTSQPTVTLTGGGGNVTATAIAQVTTFATGTIAIEVTNGGSGYGNQGSFYVTLSGGGYTTPANATAIVTGNVVSKIIMNNPGAGYTSVPILTIPSYNGGTGANATVILNTNSIVDVASFSGRLWVAAGRNVYASSAVSPTDFTSVSAVSFNMVDSTLHNNIQAIISANNFLYIFGEDSINVFSNLQVTTSGQTVFTNTNVSASIGTKRIYAIFAYFRSILFMNDYGVYALVGSTTTKISDPLDGIFPYIDFSKPITAGQALLNNILCAVFNFYVNSSCPYGFGGNRYIQAVFFDKKWFITYQGAIQYVTSAPIGGKVNLYGTVANALYQLYSNTGTPVSSYIQTALQDMGDPIRTKQALKFGIEATLTTGGQFSATVDSENGASQVYSLTNTTVTWSNNVGTTITWINNSSTVIGWLQEVGYYLYKSDAAQYGKYLGLTMTSNSAAFVVNTFEFEHELRVRF